MPTFLTLNMVSNILFILALIFFMPERTTRHVLCSLLFAQVSVIVIYALRFLTISESMKNLIICILILSSAVFFLFSFIQYLKMMFGKYDHEEREEDITDNENE